MFCNAWQFLLKTGLCSGVDAVIKAYRLYLEQCPQPPEGPLLALTRAWTLVRFVESGLLELSSCNCCGGNFITHAHQPVGSFACSLCQPPSRAVKRRKLSRDAADIIPQLLDEQSNRLFNRNGVDNTPAAVSHYRCFFLPCLRVNRPTAHPVIVNSGRMMSCLSY